MGESGQSLPFLRIPGTPEGEGGDGESLRAGEEAGANACCRSELRGWCRGRGEPRLWERRRKAVEGFGACRDAVWLTCNEAWLCCTGSRLRVPALLKVRGKKGPSGTGTR